MSDTYKLLVDTNTHVLETIEEQTNKDEPKKLYIQGIFGQAGAKNKNGRVYDPEEMVADIERYNKEFISKGRSFNELNHPSEADVNLERICDRTVSLHMENDGTIIGKALVLDTPMGRIERALLEDDGKVGKSSRALGQMTESRAKDGSNCNYVSSLRLVCFDSVFDPSVGSAIVDPLMEQREWIIGVDGGFLVKPFDHLVSNLAKLPKHGREDYVVESVVRFLNMLK